MKIVAATGHRPSYLPCVNKVVDERTKREDFIVIEDSPWLIDVNTRLLDWLQFENPDKILTGMALGWDMWVADAAVQLNIPYIAYVPFAGQESTWSKKDIRHYNYLLSKAEKVKICSDNHYKTIVRSNFKDMSAFSYAVKDFYRKAFLKRDRMMVDDATQIVALWDPTVKMGGTYYTVKYAMKNKKHVTNLWVQNG